VERNIVRVPVGVDAVAVYETCQACGRELTGRVDRKYCGSRCRQAGRRKRLKGDVSVPERVRQVRLGRKRLSDVEGFAYDVDVMAGELDREVNFLSCFVAAAVTVRRQEFVSARLARRRRTPDAIEFSLPTEGRRGRVGRSDAGASEGWLIG
jgi:hypothetical protein